MLCLVAVFVVGCAQLGGKQEYTKKSGVGPGMNAKGEVVDSKLVESGYGQHVKGLGDWEGEITGKAWIPYYFGSDRHRYEMVYKNQGRLIFAGGSLNDLSGGNLIWIINNRTEPQYR